MNGDREVKVTNRVAGALKRAVAIASTVIGKKIFRAPAPSFFPLNITVKQTSLTPSPVHTSSGTGIFFGLLDPWE